LEVAGIEYGVRQHHHLACGTRKVLIRSLALVHHFIDRNLRHMINCRFGVFVFFIERNLILSLLVHVDVDATVELSLQKLL